MNQSSVPLLLLHALPLDLGPMFSNEPNPEENGQVRASLFDDVWIGGWLRLLVAVAHLWPGIQGHQE